MKKSENKLTHISRRKSLEVMTNLGKPLKTWESCNSWLNPCKTKKSRQPCWFILYADNHLTPWHVYFMRSPVGLYAMFMLFRQPSCSMTCLLYEENSIGFYSIFTLCRQPSWSPWHVYFLRRVLLVSITFLLYADNHLGLYIMFTFKKESCWFL